MKARGITPLVEEAVKRGPLLIGGTSYTLGRGPALDRTLQALDNLGPGPRILLSHAPDVAMAAKDQTLHFGELQRETGGAVKGLKSAVEEWKEESWVGHDME